MTDQDLKEIEETEKEVLFKLGMIFKDSIKDFSTSMDRSLKYLDKIVFPIIMGSQKDKSYNPFAEIIEKYVLHILTCKFEREGYHLLPLGYSSDLTMENEEHILNIDIKTANIHNPSDFRNTINVGINQMTHVAKLPIKGEFLPDPFFVYPNIPPYYEIDKQNFKLVLTYGLIFIYPSYRKLIRDINKKFKEVKRIFHEKIENILTDVIVKKLNIKQEEVDTELDSARINLITQSLLRGVFIHSQEKESILEALQIKVVKEENDIIEKFLEELNDFTTNLRNKDIKPIAVIAISLPNGLLKDRYLPKFVSGKEYANSARYHYEDGIFEILKEKEDESIPRVIFLDVKEEYVTKLKKYFDKINVLDYVLKEL
ncbi:MAG TPA: hypothetical protein PKI14_03645 [Fervidobacterium sp.]|nr:hypothetical protein [Fervidobacterium sp.]HQE48260.1 hypothetical protein [Fervidobacterium sp.]HUM42025.1 hypothetical protein [Fervidobacterium sp.]